MGDKSSELDELLLSENWEVLGNESIKEGLNLGLLSFTALVDFSLFIGIINIFDESLKSLSLESDWGVTLDLKSKVFNEDGECVLNGLD